MYQARIDPADERADVDEEQEIATTELCPTCDGSGQILGPPT